MTCVTTELAKALDDRDHARALAHQLGRDMQATADAADQLRAELADLRERFTALAAVEEHIGESCGNASHNIRDVLNGEDPRIDAEHYRLDWRDTP